MRVRCLAFLLQVSLASLLLVAAARAAPNPVRKPTAAPPSPSISSSAQAASEGATAFSGEAFFRCVDLPRGKRFHLTFKPDSEIADVIGWVAGVTCRRFILGGGVQLAGKKVTIIAPDEMKPEEVYPLFLALLDSVQLTVEPAGKFLRIIDATKAVRSPGALDGTAAGGGYATRLVRLAHAEASEVAALLQQFKGEHGTVVAHPPLRLLIITDRAAVIDRLLALCREVDAAGDAPRLWSLPVSHMPVGTLAEKLADLFGTGAPAGGRAGGKAAMPAQPPAGPRPPSDPLSGAGILRLVGDERSGRIIVVATEPAFARIVAVARTLDAPVDGKLTQTHVYRCKHADCDAAAAILGSLTGASVSRAVASDRQGGARAAPSAPALPQAAPSAAAAGVPPVFDGDVRITADPATNALLVMASAKDFRTLERLLADVDVPRKQVFVEAHVLEILLTKDRTVGVAMHAGRQVAGGKATAVGGFDARRSLLFDQEALGGALVGLSGMGVGAPLEGVARLLGVSPDQIPSFGAFLRLLQTSENVNLVATPQILITNNQEGEISVGQRVPFRGAYVAAPGAGLSGILPTVSVNREDVALTLKMTPHVNEDNLIRLEIDQEISEIASTQTSELGPTTTKRTAKTTLFARDQQTVIVGGLMKDKIAESASKVPFLGDIPVIGALFRSTTKTVQKQNIIIALTPYVITDSADLVRVLETKLRQRREYLAQFGSEEERRVLHGPVGLGRSHGMVEAINRAFRAEDREEASRRAAGVPPAAPSEIPIEAPPGLQ